MELKNILDFEVTKNERTYRFSIPAGAPYGETYDVIFSFLDKIMEQQRTSLDYLKAKNSEQNTTSQG